MTPRYFERYYEPSRPRETRGGIKARTRRGAFATNWWGERWIEVLETFDVGARLRRGRAYARRGQVLSIDVQPGLVTALVQGSRVRPYRVELRIKTLPPEMLARLAGPISRRPLLAARLLTGQMPEEVPAVFREAGLSLFPDRSADLSSSCTCPDWSNPCKHIAAVYYLLGEEFDRDPFLILKLRGIDREALVALAVGDRGAQPDPPPDDDREASPLPADPEAFWRSAGTEGDDLIGNARVPAVHAALPRRLGGFPFWRGDRPFLPAMEESYRRASAAGLKAFLGEPTAAPAEPTAATRTKRP
ncbi:MAG TPA: hypothetical protein DEQ28_08115 [Clostridiales bacterium]|nr:hypothetical protein [Clostridiales bacterium]